jgi:hypothetical protein
VSTQDVAEAVRQINWLIPALPISDGEALRTILAENARLSALVEEAGRVMEPFADGASYLHPSSPDDGITLDGIEARAWRALASLAQQIKDRTHDQS